MSPRPATASLALLGAVLLTAVLGGILTGFLAFLAPRAVAGEDDDLAALRQRIQVLAEEVKSLEAMREDAAAAALGRRVKALERDLRRRLAAKDEAVRRQAAEAAADRPSPDEEFARRAIEQGLDLLRRLYEDPDEAESARELAREIAKVLQEHAAEQGPGTASPAATESAHARRHADALRIALRVLTEAGKPDAAEGVERALRALEMLVAGRGDPEAREVIQRAPSHEGVLEVLRLALDLLASQGKPDLASPLQDLVRELEQASRPGGEPETGHLPPAAHRPPEPPPADLRRRLEAMERRLDALLEAASALRDEVKDLREQLDAR